MKRIIRVQKDRCGAGFQGGCRPNDSNARERLLGDEAERSDYRRHRRLGRKKKRKKEKRGGCIRGFEIGWRLFVAPLSNAALGGIKSHPRRSMRLSRRLQIEAAFDYCQRTHSRVTRHPESK